jgi:hypothetical protein
MSAAGKNALPCLSSASVWVRHDEDNPEKMRCIMSGPEVSWGGRGVGSKPLPPLSCLFTLPHALYASVYWSSTGGE